MFDGMIAKIGRRKTILLFIIILVGTSTHLMGSEQANEEPIKDAKITDISEAGATITFKLNDRFLDNLSSLSLQVEDPDGRITGRITNLSKSRALRYQDTHGYPAINENRRQIEIHPTNLVGWKTLKEGKFIFSIKNEKSNEILAKKTKKFEKPHIKISNTILDPYSEYRSCMDWMQIEFDSGGIYAGEAVVRVDHKPYDIFHDEVRTKEISIPTKETNIGGSSEGNAAPSVLFGCRSKNGDKINITVEKGGEILDIYTHTVQIHRSVHESESGSCEKKIAKSPTDNIAVKSWEFTSSNSMKVVLEPHHDSNIIVREVEWRTLDGSHWEFHGEKHINSSESASVILNAPPNTGYRSDTCVYGTMKYKYDTLEEDGSLFSETDRAYDRHGGRIP